MPNFRSTAIAMGLCVFAWACGPTPASLPASTPSSAAPGTWAIELSQTGGFVGVDLDVRVTSAGQLVASNRRSGRTSNAQLTQVEIEDLGGLYRAAASAGYAGTPSACADCFAYELNLTSGDESRTIMLDDVSLSGTAAEPLVAYLIRLRDGALAAP